MREILLLKVLLWIALFIGRWGVWEEFEELIEFSFKFIHGMVKSLIHVKEHFWSLELRMSKSHKI